MKKTLAVVALLSIALVATWWWKGGDGAAVEPKDPVLAFDRIWIDHLPKNDKDIVHVFAAISEEPVGIFQAQTQWRGSYELFRYEAHGDQIRFLYPQTGEREKARLRARECSDKGMDFCLQIDGASRGVTRYYSREGWEIGKHADAAALRERAGAIVQSLSR